MLWRTGNKMVPLKFWLLVFVVAVVFSEKATGRVSKDPLAVAFHALERKEEKTEFLKYFLAAGLRDWALSQPRPPKFLASSGPDGFTKNLNISKESIEKFENLNIPKESRKKLLEWTKKEFNLSTNNIVELVRNRKSSGWITFPDIGELCCPW